MRQFVKTTVEKSSFAAVTEAGGVYIVRIPIEEDAGAGTVDCWETISDTEPDTAAIQSELEAYTAMADVRRTKASARRRMREIQAELSATDYLALKAYEGEDMTGHEGWREQRAALRREYRELEQQTV